MPKESLQFRQFLKCLAAFFTFSPFTFRNLSTQALLHIFSCSTTPKKKKTVIIPILFTYIFLANKKNELISQNFTQLITFHFFKFSSCEPD